MTNPDKNRIIGVFLLLFGLVWLGPALAWAQAEPIRIGVSLGLSGEFTVMARDQERAFRLWEQELNRAGGLLGREVRLTVADDRSDPAQARSRYHHFIHEERMDLLLAPFSSEITAAVLPLFEENQYPLLASGAAGDDLWDGGSRYLFGIFTPAGKIPAYFMEMLVMYGIDSLALFHSNSRFSRAAAAGVKKWATWLKLDLPLTVSLGDDQPDFVALVQRARAAQVRAIILAGHFNDAVALRRAMDQAGWRPEVYYATQGPANPAFREVLGEAAEGVFGTEQWQYLGGVATPDTEEFIAAYRKQYRVEPSYFSVTAYSAARTLAEMVEQVGSLDRPRIRDALAELDRTGLAGRFKVDASGRQIRNFTLVTQWQEGRLEVVWPANIKRREPVFSLSPQVE